MRLVVLEKSTLLTEVECREEAIYIGADENCDVHLPEGEVGAQVGVVYPVSDDSWVFEQTNPDGVVQLNGAAVVDKASIKIGDQLKIHDYLIRLEAADIEPETSQAAPPAQRTSVDRLRRFVQYSLPAGSLIKKPTEDVAVNYEQRAKCGRANVLLGQCSTIEKLMEVALQVMADSFGAHRAWMGVRKLNYGTLEYVEGRMSSGQMADLPATGENLKLRVLDRDQFVLLPYGDDSCRAPVMAGPLMAQEGALGMIYIDAGEEARRFANQDLDAFILFANTLAAQLAAIFEQIAKNRDAMLEGEVTVAHAIQTRLTPRKLPQWAELQFGAFREMGHERTSNIYDLLRLSNQMALFMIAHTNAVGPVPSMLIAQAQAAFRVAAMHLDAPQVILRTLNNIMYDGLPDHRLDCFIGVIEPHTGNMRFAQAGKMGAYIISARGEERALSPKAPTPSISESKDFDFKLYPQKLRSGETLALFTPGVVTARNSKGEIFGEERFISILCDGFGQQASGMLRDLLSDLQQFTESGAQPDDITVILAHRL